MNTFHSNIESMHEVAKYHAHKNDERSYQRLVNASWFFLGVITAGIVMHIMIINPLLNSLI
jgi:hypothetical protein